MTTAANGIIARSKELLRDTLAACYAFQNWNGLSLSLEQAKARIYYDALPPPIGHDAHTLAELREYRPYALIYKSGAVEVRNDSSPNGYHATGQLTILLESDVALSTSHDPGEVERLMENFVGSLIWSQDNSQPGLVELAGQAGYFAPLEIRDDGPYRTEETKLHDIGDAIRHYIDVTWGFNVQ